MKPIYLVIMTYTGPGIFNSHYIKQLALFGAHHILEPRRDFMCMLYVLQKVFDSYYVTILEVSILEMCLELFNGHHTNILKLLYFKY